MEYLKYYLALFTLLIFSLPAYSDWKEVKSIRAWTLQQKTELMTDRKRCRIFSSAKNREGGGKLARTNLVFMESEQDPNKANNLKFYTSGILSGSKYITYRFDKNKPVDMRIRDWESTYHQIDLSHQSNGPAAYNFRESQRFILKVNILNEGPMTLVFSANGFSNAYDAAIKCQKSSL
jgi:hypothetical protein